MNLVDVAGLLARSTAVSVVVSAVLLVAACDPGVDVDVDATGPISLAETTPGLIDGARAVVFTFSTLESCRTLVDAPASTLDDLIDAEPNPTKQRVPMFRGQVDADRDGAFEDGSARHTFGSIPPNAPVSFLAIAVTRDPGSNFSLSGLEGTIFAVGCRSIVPTPGKRHGVPIVLAPSGLR
jgi:hypothetical protein